MKRPVLFVIPLLFLAVAAYGGYVYSQNGQQAMKPAAPMVQQEQEQQEQPALAAAEEPIVVTLYNPNKEKIGEATLVQRERGVLIKLEARQLPPGKHGFHIHETGACDPPDFQSAGEHFNPYNKEHGLKNPKGPHAGDMPNITVGQDGRVSVEVLNPRVTLSKGVPHSLLRPGGTSLVIHANPDDMVSQPSGNAGDRIACGVIAEK